MDSAKLPAVIELDAGDRTFATGLLLDLLAALARTLDGDLIAVLTRQPDAVAADLDAWSRLTGHAVVGRTDESGGTRWVIRRGVAADLNDRGPVGTRLWVYVNFDCNLRCDYCCVRSSPTAPRRALGIDRVRRIADEAPPLGIREFFITGGEPFLLSDIDAIVSALAEAAPVTVLTNGMLFTGTRLAALRRFPRDRVTLQISLDSPDSRLHDAHRGRGAWQRAVDGIELARGEGFRVRLAATVATDDDERRFRAFLDARQVAPDDRVIRRVALRGFATTGIALSRSDLVPEITITADGVYWHPVAAGDDDMLVTREVFPLSVAFQILRAQVTREQAHAGRLATVFNCA
jgi:organic radical activating enzyme/TusA-related sulfurtransferase